LLDLQSQVDVPAKYWKVVLALEGMEPGVAKDARWLTRQRILLLRRRHEKNFSEGNPHQDVCLIRVMGLHMVRGAMSMRCETKGELSAVLNPLHPTPSTTSHLVYCSNPAWQTNR